MAADDQTIENICQAFAEIIDAKSPFTYRHSNGVADAVVAMSRHFSLSEPDTTFIAAGGPAALRYWKTRASPTRFREKPERSRRRGVGHRQAAPLLQLRNSAANYRLRRTE